MFTSINIGLDDIFVNCDILHIVPDPLARNVLTTGFHVFEILGERAAVILLRLKPVSTPHLVLLCFRAIRLFCIFRIGVLVTDVSDPLHGTDQRVLTVLDHLSIRGIIFAQVEAVIVFDRRRACTMIRSF
jgi:hypothetical protein